MLLYRVTSMNLDEGRGVFYDATASLQDAIRMAKLIQRREPTHQVSVEAESWPSLPWWKYRLHRILGTHKGFGVNFKDRHRLTIDDIRTVWPDGHAQSS